MTPSVDDLERWLVEQVADLLGLPTSRVSVTAPFTDLGLDSTAAVGMTGQLEEWLEVEIDPTSCYDYPTIAALAAHVGTLVGAERR